MSDDRPPGAEPPKRRPQPAPERQAPEPVAPAEPVAKAPPATAPRQPEAAPASEPSEPPEHPPEAKPSRRSRTDRRRAEKDTGRRTGLRTNLHAAIAVLVLVIGISLTVLLSGGQNPVRKSSSATPSPTSTATGANLDDPNLVTGFLGGTASDIAAVTTYDYRNLDDALNAGLAVTTGRYREAYRDALTGALAATATAEHVVHTFEILELGIGEIDASGTRAKVLVFGTQRVIDDSTGPEAAVSPVTLCATVRRIGSQYLISDLVENANAGLPPGGPELPAAAEAARSEVINLLSYQRADFDADLQRALAGATSPLTEQIQKNAAGTKAAMIRGKYDTSATVTAIAVVRSDAETATLLVAADSSRLADGASTPSVTQERYEVTVTRTPQGWAASRVTPVDGSG